MTEEKFYYYTGSVDENEPFTLISSGTVQCDKTYGYERNSYPNHIFEYIIDGKGTVEVDNVLYRPEKSDIYFIRKGCRHKYYADPEDPWKKIWFTVSGTLADYLLQAYHIDHMCCLRSPGLQSYFQDIQQLLKQDTADLQKQAVLIFHELILEMSRINLLSARKHSELALHIKNYLDTNLENKVVMQDLCQVVYKSLSQINRVFKHEFGMTPKEYLSCKRINAAKLYLLNTEISVQEIAKRLQYSDEHHLASSFKKRTGVTPTAYRKNS